MLDISRRCLGLSLAIALVALSPVAAATPATDALFPDKTLFYLQIVNFPQLEKNWDATKLHKFFDDPSMQPFKDDIEEQLKKKREEKNTGFGLTRDDIEGMSTGEIGVAVVEIAGGKAALCVLTEVTGKEDQAKTVLEKIEKDLVKQKGKKKVEKVAGVNLTTWDLPPEEGSKQKREAAFFIKGGYFGGFEDIAAAKAVLARFDSSSKGGLANEAPYQTALKRAALDAKAAEIKFFLRPLQLGFAIRNSRDDPRHRGDVDMLKVLNEQGFDAVKAIAGQVNLNVDGQDVEYRVSILAPPPFQDAMKMMTFPNVDKFETPGWIAQNVASYLAFNMDMQIAFDNFGPIFNELFGEGDSGAWDEVLEGLRIDEDGPKIDLKNELIKFLGTHGYVIADVRMPITPTSQRQVIALELTDPDKFSKALDRVMKDDPQVIPHPPIDGVKIYEIIPEEEEEEEDDAPIRRRRRGAGRNAAAAAPAAKPKPRRPAPKAVANSAVCVGHKHLLIATHVNYLREVIKQPEKLLKDDAGFKGIMAILAKKRPAKISFIGFNDLAKELHTGYELFRTGKWRQNDRMIARMVREMTSEEGKEDDLTPRYDGSKLPPFETVSKYLGLGGFYAQTEEQGWFLYGFTSGK